MSERTAGHDATIVRAAIYPAIGIARVGNSETAYFLAPEVTDPLPEPVGFTVIQPAPSNARRCGFASMV
jgi:hypothetical protein